MPWAGAKALHRAPRQIAQAIVEHLDLAGSYFDKVEIAGPGFLNFTLGSKWYADVLCDIQAEGKRYGAIDEGKGETVMVEFVSANPTGPMHIATPGAAVLGDALASVLERAGYDVWREFYVNDAGNQIHKFALSIDARYLQRIQGEENVPFPEDGYRGEDIKELAQAFYDAHGADWKDKSEEERQAAMALIRLSVNIPACRRICAAITSSTTSGSWSPASTTAAMWRRRWACCGTRAGPTRRTGPSGWTPAACSGRSTWPRGRAGSRWTSWT